MTTTDTTVSKLIINKLTRAQYNSIESPSDQELYFITDQSADEVPVGLIFYFASSSAPEGYLVCNGAAISRADYPELYLVCGTKFGEGDGSTTFNIPYLVDNRHIEGTLGEYIGSYLGESVGTHGHTGYANQVGDHVHYINLGTNEVTLESSYSSGASPYPSPGSAAYPGSANHAHSVQGNSYGGGTHSHDLTINDYIGTTRPKSLTLLPCIKY